MLHIYQSLAITIGVAKVFINLKMYLFEMYIHWKGYINSSNLKKLSLLSMLKKVMEKIYPRETTKMSWNLENQIHDCWLSFFRGALWSFQGLDDYFLIHSWLYALFDCLFSPSASEISEIVHCLVSSCGWDGPMLWRSTKDLVFFSLHDQDHVNHQICGQEGILHWIMLAQFWQLCPFTATKDVLLLRSSCS